MQWILKKIIGSKNERDVKKLRPLVDQIKAAEEPLLELSDEQVQAKTIEFRERLAAGEELDDLIPEAFAVVKNACRRLLGNSFELLGAERSWVEVPYDVQLIGGVAMHNGRIAEMATGEGKTLVATLPTYLNALTGKGVHVVTVNDYLARRDALWMGQLYNWLGLTVGVIQGGMKPAERREQYACDITYGTNSEFGFDYLRDNMTYRPDDMVQRGHYFAIVDEIDSILIDEARTPLIISGPMDHSSEEVYREYMPPVKRLVAKQTELIKKIFKNAKQSIEEGDNDATMGYLYQIKQGMPRLPDLLTLMEDTANLRLMEKAENRFISDTYKEQARALREELYFTIEEKHHDAALTDAGCVALNPSNPDAYLLPDLPTLFADLDGNEEISEEERTRLRAEIQDHYSSKSQIIHAVDQLIRAFCLYEKDKEYIVVDNKVIIVDSQTGRAMEGRRWSDGLHQAVEAKEGTAIERETQTYATITIQNYFRMYDKLSGMTGTAETEADEFMQIYKLDVLVIPTNRPTRRIDYNDLIYRTEREKNAAVVEEIEDCHKRGQPILVGTVSVESSERLSKMLDKKNIIHNVLNAKAHEREAEIVARAGMKGAVTIATNMAGRGTDIKLGKGVINWTDEVLDSYMSLTDTHDGETLYDNLIDNPCGLHVIGTERNDARRIDRQLRGRCSRQGDPGSARFYVSLEDKLMRNFGSDRVSNILDKLGGMEEGEAIESGMLTKVIERSQRKIEQWHFSVRKKTLEYDDVMNQQREIVYGRRVEILQSENPQEFIFEFVEERIFSEAEKLYADAIRDEDEGFGEIDKIYADWVLNNFPIVFKEGELAGCQADINKVAELTIERVKEAYAFKCQMEDPEQLPEVERYVLLHSIDDHWQEYLREFDAVRQGIHLISQAQKDPLVEFKHKAYTMFLELMDNIGTEVASMMFRVASARAHSYMANLPQTTVTDADPLKQMAHAMEATGGNVPSSAAPENQARANTGREAAMQQALVPVKREAPKVGRNDPCSCGSGRKYKKCCGKGGE